LLTISLPVFIACLYMHCS